MNQSSKLVTGGLSVDALLANLIEHLRNLLVLRTCGRDSELVEVPGIPMDELFGQAQRFDPLTSRAMPFCSARCRLIDLGRWLGEGYSVPAPKDDGEEEAGEREE